MEPTLDFGALNYTVLVVYVGAMVAIGALLAGKQKTGRDFFLAGGGMNWVLVAMSIFASITSAVTYMGLPGLVYEENLSFLFGIVMMPVAAPFIIRLFLPVYRRYNVTTSYEYILHRFGQTARYTVSALFILARLGWMGTVIYAPALALSVVTGIDIRLAILTMGAIGTLYTVLGGLAAVIWTDAVQFFVLVGGAIWVAVTLTIETPGGIGEIFRVASDAGHLNVLSLRPSLTEMTMSVVMVSYFIQFMHDYGVDQVTVQRLMATKDQTGMARATLVNSFVSVVIVFLLSYIGLGLLAYGQSDLSPFPDGLARDQIFPYYIVHALPAGISGLVITGIFAAAMSSVDSGVNSLSTVVVNDFIGPLRSTQKEGDGHEVFMARVLTLLFGALATGVAFIASNIADIIKTSQAFLGLFSGPILGLFMLGVLTKRGTFAGWIVGAIPAFLLTVWMQRFTEVHFVYYFPTTFFISFGVGYIASFILAPGKDSPETA